MYKHVFMHIAALLCLLCATGAQAKTRVFACEPEWAALAEEIGGEQVEARSATTAGQDPHYIQARPSLIAGIRKADLLICSGSDLEIGWLPLLLRKGNNANIQPGKPGYLMASKYVQRLEIPTLLDRSQGDLHAQGNPHIQTDPRNIGIVARVVAERLQKIDPAQSAFYRVRLDAFEQRWQQAISMWQDRAAPLRGTPVVVHHKSWAYLLHWLGMTEAGTLEAKPGVPPSAAHLNELLDQLHSQPAALIIRTPYQDPKPSEWLSRETGIPATALPFTIGGGENAADLFSLFDTTIDTLLDTVGKNVGGSHGQ